MRTTLAALLAAATAASAAPTDGVTDSPCKKNCHPIPWRQHSQIHNIGNDSHLWPWQAFKSSALKPPQLEITGPGNSSDLDPGYIFLAPSGPNPTEGIKQSLALIMDNEGELVYAVNANGSTDFRVQEYAGKPHLTFWYGENTIGLDIGHGYGQVRFLDEELREKTFSPKKNLVIDAQQATPYGVVDLHEHQIATSGEGKGETMLITAYNNTPADLRAFGVKNGWIVDSIVAEFEVSTGKLLFLWNPADHGVSYNLSQVPLGTPGGGNGTETAPWDWCHINSAEKVGENYLINSRHLWSTWLVNGTNGEIIWTVNGGGGGDFAAFPHGATFSWQHFARVQNMSEKSFTYSIFDNHDNAALKKDAGLTTGLLLELALPPSKKQAPKVLRNLTVPADPLMAGSQGSYIPFLPNGNALMGYGQLPVTREYAAKVVDGSNQPLLRQWRFGVDNVVQSYRGFKMPWHATPAAYGPSLVVEKANSTAGEAESQDDSLSGEKKKEAATAYVSWNGATDVTDWDVYAGATKSALKFVGRAAKKGFETTFNATGSCVQVAAVQGGKSVRKSKVACV